MGFINYIFCHNITYANNDKGVQKKKRSEVPGGLLSLAQLDFARVTMLRSVRNVLAMGLPSLNLTPSPTTTTKAGF